MPTKVTPHPALVAFVAFLLTAIITAWVWSTAQLLRGRPLLPKDGPRRVPWGLGSVLAAVMAWLLLSLNAQLLLHEVLGTPPFGTLAFFVEQLLISGIANGLTVLLVPAVLKATSGARRSDLGLVPDQFGRNVGRGVMAWLLVAPSVLAIQWLALRIWEVHQHPMELMLRANRTPPIVVLAVVSGVILAPMAEELLFRGVILGWMARYWSEASAPLSKPTGVFPVSDFANATMVDPSSPVLLPRHSSSLSRWVPNIITSIIFAGIHAAQWPAPLALFVLSLSLGELYLRTGSLVAPILLHATFNAISTILLFTSLS